LERNIKSVESDSVDLFNERKLQVLNDSRPLNRRKLVSTPPSNGSAQLTLADYNFVKKVTALLYVTVL
jgi:hypothetical protein